ncbi:hypothetical protein [Actinomyces ruminicola]|uniref:ABC-2 family transporter protein n=1 Tax=Actinomyces ruminicola TaxID=332524 RepID=A0A1G9XQ73_9ACTO|nr:hypothetical protein [Actinomyces ruminicola]SDM98927.1 hypothetical protein SAMN04487766_11041 [Actinomyces ruminicola]
MLRTLFTEEIRTQTPRSAASVGVALIVFLASLGLWRMLESVSVIAFLLQLASLAAAVAIPIIVGALAVTEYWQSMYGSRGYLTMSIPVRGRTIFAAKTIYAYLAVLVACLLFAACLLAWFGMLAHSNGWSVGEVLEPFKLWWQNASTTLRVFWIASIPLSLAVTVAQLAAVMSVGAREPWNSLGFGAPLIGLVILYVVNQIVGLVGMLFIPISLDLTTFEFTTRIMWSQFLEAVRTGSDPTLVGLGTFFLGPLLAAVMGWWAVRSIERHTSLR